MIEPKPQIWNNLRNRWKGHWIQSITVNPLVRLHCAKTFPELITRRIHFLLIDHRRKPPFMPQEMQISRSSAPGMLDKERQDCLLPAEATRVQLLGGVGPRLNSCSHGRSSTGLVSFSQRNCRLGVTGQFWPWSIRANLCLCLEWPLVTSVSSWSQAAQGLLGGKTWTPLSFLVKICTGVLLSEFSCWGQMPERKKKVQEEKLCKRKTTALDIWTGSKYPGQDVFIRRRDLNVSGWYQEPCWPSWCPYKVMA